MEGRYGRAGCEPEPVPTMPPHAAGVFDALAGVSQGCSRLSQYFKFAKRNLEATGGALSYGGRQSRPTKGSSMKRLAVAAAFTFAAEVLGACATSDPSSGGYQVSEQRIEHGVVERIDLLRQGEAQPTGLGAVLGGVAGGVIGHQIGGGRGNTAATIAGAIGGGLIGNEVERSSEGDRYRITVRLDGGARLAITEVGEGELREGDRVRVVNNRVYRE